MNSLKKLKVAIVYDRVNKWGGAERVLLTLHEMFPKAPLYTALCDLKKAPWAKVFPKIYTSFLQNIPFIKNWHEGVGWLMPIAFETFDFSEYDLVISITSEAAKGIVTGTDTLHVCYMLTPTRYLWSHHDLYFKNPILKFFSRPAVWYLKKWDKVAAQRPDQIIAISNEVRKRIKKYYKRNSEIVFPPSSSLQLTNQPVDAKYYLYVGRLVGYKKVELLVKAFNKLDKKLIIVGNGRQYKRLKKMANRNIQFLGEVSEKKLKKIYSGAKALIMPQEEDFGIVSVEAQSYGLPVIAYKKGGSLDTVVDNRTGLFFDKQSIESLAQAIAKFEKMRFNHKYIRENAEKFGEKRFRRELQRSLVRAYSGWRRGNQTLA